MGLQTSDLVMVALGVRADAPPIALQPPLVDAIHLRWAFRRARGFPWYGYYLFRRAHEFRGARCLAAALAGRAAGTDLGTTFVSPLGQLSSDDPLILSDDFPQAGRAEVALDGHAAVRLDLPADEPAFKARLAIGFRLAADALQCLDFRKLRPELQRNPLVVGPALVGPGAATVTFDAKDVRGGSLPRIRLVEYAGQPLLPRHGIALEVGRQLDIVLPNPARTVRLDLTADQRGTIVEALDKNGRVIDTASLFIDARRPITTELTTTVDIHRLRIRTVAGLVLLHRLCWTRPAPRVEIPITAYDGTMVVAQTRVSGRAGQVVETVVAFDRITAIEIGGGPAALVELCVQIVPDVALKEWQPVPDCPQPLLLPLSHPHYPHQNGAVDLAAAETRALARIVYGPTNPWAGAGFTSLHDRLIALVDGGPPGPPARAMAAPERAEQHVVGTPSPAAPGLDAPNIPSLHPLDLVLLGAVHPAVAQMTALYWADKTADPRSGYDYLIVADHQNVGRGKAEALLQHITRNGWSDVDAWIVFDRRLAAAPPLAAPAGVRAYALPSGTYRDRGGVDAGVTDADGNVGLTWTRGLDAQGYLRPDQPVLYHVWRDEQGNGAQPQAAPEADTLVTRRGPLLVTHPPGVQSESPHYPGDWPPFSLTTLDFGLREGWYGYQVNGIDIFGRFSARSAFAEWRQWAPAPDPKPWYYVDPPSDRVIHAASVRVLDRTAPPPPAFIEAWVLDPGDPVVVSDAALAAWRQSLPAAQRDTLIGLRVRWRWDVAQQRQAPDTREFRIYWHPGSTPPADSERIAGWQIRCHVTPYAANVTVDAHGSRSYDLFLPPAPGQGPFGAGVPLAPTRAEPLLYANVTVTAVDSTPHAPDTWPGANALAGRSGNESRAASPSRVYRVLREPPPPPLPIVDSDRVYATAADWHARSYHTFRWRPEPHLFTHVFRAMDESVFAADWALRPRNTDLQPNDAARFPDPAAEPSWNAAKRQAACDALNGFQAIPKTDAGKTQALRAYRALSDDALRVLANLTGCEKAFVQLTLHALDPDDVKTHDRRGPDDATDYVARPALRRYVDTLDGRATNRYLYRAAYVDAAQNRSTLSAIGTPVRLPNVVPPRAPAITKVTGGDRRITLAWASNREADLLDYRVFRADTAAAAADLRSMTQVATIAADPDPAARPAAVTWSDTPVPGLTDFWYRVVAVDRPDPIDPRGGGGNLSTPSPAVKGRARQPAPSPPVVQAAAWNPARTEVRIDWQVNDPFLVPRLERRRDEGQPWTIVAAGLAPGTVTAVDTPPDPLQTYDYRVRVRDHLGQQAVSDPLTTA